MRTSLLALLLSLPSTLVAQATTSPREDRTSEDSNFAFGVAAGVTLSDQRLGYRGAHAKVAAERARVVGPLGAYADFMVHRLSRNTFGGPMSPHTSVFGASAGLVLPLAPATSPIQPYALGGAGSYSTEYGSTREWHFGLNVGAGVRARVRGVEPFLEWRMQDIRDSSTPRLAPISLGVRY